MASERNEQILIQIISDSQESNQHCEKTIKSNENQQKGAEQSKQKITSPNEFQYTSKNSRQENIHEDLRLRDRKLKKSVLFSAACEGDKILSLQTQMQQKTLSVTCSNQYQFELKHTKSQVYSDQDNYGDQIIFTSKELLHIAYKQPHRTFSQDLDNYVTQSSQQKFELDKQEFELDNIQPYRKYSLDQFDNQSQITFQSFSNQIFVKYSSYVVQICEVNIQYLHSHFENHQIVSPMVQTQIFLHNYHHVFWALLFGYYSRTNEQILKQGLIQISKNKQKIKASQKSSSGSWINLSNYFNKKSYSKAEILKNSLMQKLKTHACLSKILKKQSKQKNYQKQMLQELAHIEIVLSFERTLNYWIQKQKTMAQKNQKQKCKQMVIKTRKQMKKWMCEHNISIKI